MAMTAAAARNLSLTDEVGAHAMERLTETIRGSVRAMLPASDCRTVLLEADDESYMHDRQPWPVAPICNRTGGRTEWVGG